MCSFPTQDEREAEAQRQGRRASRRVANRSPPLDSRRQPTPRLVQDLVGYYMPREDLGKQGLMLDPELYTPNRLIKRDACRFHPRVRRVLQRIWCVPRRGDPSRRCAWEGKPVCRPNAPSHLRLIPGDCPSLHRAAVPP